jgi:antitoxin component of RelBE/YafQ-DinJ toxin-antitoxin module
VTYQLHLGISDDLKNDLQAYADARGITLAAAVRILLFQALKQAGETG